MTAMITVIALTVDVSVMKDGRISSAHKPYALMIVVVMDSALPVNVHVRLGLRELIVPSMSVMMIAAVMVSVSRESVSVTKVMS
jgi:hypothetical protein